MVSCDSRAVYRPHPKERACRRRSANANARTRVSMGEDEPLRLPSCLETHRSALRAAERSASSSRCDAPRHEAGKWCAYACNVIQSS